jgi:aminoglycoside phosphotransferase
MSSTEIVLDRLRVPCYGSLVTDTTTTEFDWSDWTDEELADHVARLEARPRKGAYQRRALASATATLAARAAAAR